MKELILLLITERGLGSLVLDHMTEVDAPMGRRDRREILRSQHADRSKRRRAVVVPPIAAMSMRFGESAIDCREEDVSEATRLIARWGPEYMLNREYEAFLRKCKVTIGDAAIDDLMLVQSKRVLTTLRRITQTDEPEPSSRSEIEDEIDSLWAEITSMPTMLKELISVPNYNVIRYVAGVEAGARLLLERGGLETILHSKNSLATHQLVQSLEALLWKPLPRLLAMGQPLDDDVKRVDSALYRPKYMSDVVFLWGHDDDFAEHFSRAWRGRVQVLLENYYRTQSKHRLIPYTSLCSLFRSKIDEFMAPFDLINLEDTDKLEALVGPACARDLLENRARYATDQLVRYLVSRSPVDNAALSRLAEVISAEDILAASEALSHELRSFPALFSPKTTDYISFFLGPWVAPALTTRQGCEKVISVDHVDGTKVEVAVWDAFMPSAYRLREAFATVIHDQMQSVAAEKSRFAEIRTPLEVESGI